MGSWKGRWWNMGDVRDEMRGAWEAWGDGRWNVGATTCTWVLSLAAPTPPTHMAPPTQLSPKPSGAGGVGPFEARCGGAGPGD